MKTIYSPAKLNLFLEVTGKRPDNYHNIDSIFLTINLYDKIDIKFVDENKIEVISDKVNIPSGGKNIIYKAVKLVEDYFKIDTGVSIFLHKEIPAGAGLGGGSSNAASVIKELKRSWNLGSSDEELLKLCSKIGADVPFFYKGYPLARCTGIGDIVEPLDIKCGFGFVLVYPNMEINTGLVYNNLNLTNGQKSSKILIEAIKQSDLLKLAVSFFNRLSEPVEVMFPLIPEIRKKLLDFGCLGACMSGSGSSVFGLAENEQKGLEILDKIRSFNNKWSCYYVSGIENCSGLKSNTVVEAV